MIKRGTEFSAVKGSEVVPRSVFFKGQAVFNPCNSDLLVSILETTLSSLVIFNPQRAEYFDVDHGDQRVFFNLKSS